MSRDISSIKFKSIFFELLVLLLFVACTDKDRVKIDGFPEEINSFSVLKQLFENPPADYRTVPFMVWNAKVTKEKINDQLEDLKKSGCGGVIIHPRYGLITEYIGTEWYELVKYTVQKGKDMNMKVWLYDENPYPSGFAGGHVPAEMPESYLSKQGMVLHKAAHVTEKDKEKYAYIFQRKNNDLINITDSLSDYYGLRGDFYRFKWMYNFTERTNMFAGYGYVDLIMPGVTEKFIELTMPGYETTIGEEFGKTVTGIFTDEPNIAPPSKNSIRYTPGLFEIFYEKHGYYLENNLPSLFEDIGQWKKVRYHYYELLLELFIDRWSKPWYEYCETNNLKWTGHYWEHGWPSPMHGGDNMAMYAWHQVPGIDLLFTGYSETADAQFGNVRAVKELASVANQFDRKRTLAETYGGSGWDLSFETMKRYGDWMYAMGVNTMNQHLSYMDIHGERKHDWPQSFSYHTPWWEHYSVLNNYYARLSLALSSGKQVNKILVIEPTTTMWTYSTISANDNLKRKQLGDDFQNFVNSLEKNHIEYDLGCENIIKDHGEIEKGKFVINKRHYNMVILPPGLENLARSTYSLLEKYVEQGGYILSLADIPLYIDGEVSEMIASLAYEYCEQFVMGNSCLEGKNKKSCYSEEYYPVKVGEWGGNVYHHRREFSDGQLLFLSNADSVEMSEGEIIMTGKNVHSLDLFTGKIHVYKSVKKKNKLTINFSLPPSGSLLLFVSNSGRSETINYEEETREEVIANEGYDIQILDENVLTLDYCDLIIDQRTEKQLLFFNAADKAFKHYGFKEGNPWCVSVQYKKNTVKNNNFKKGTGFKATFYFEVSSDYEKPSSLKAVVEQPHLWHVTVNGKKVKHEKGKWWLDKSFGVYRIGQHINPGLNAISISVNPMSVYAEIQPVYILGDFGLESIVHGWKIVPAPKLKLGSWRDQKIPLYGNRVSYKKIYSLQKDKSYVLQLDKWKGTVVQVNVNEQKVGIIAFPPYEIDISDFVKEGHNNVRVIVYGSLKNTLGPHHNLWTKRYASPWTWRYAPEEQPSGNDYDLVDNGLMNDFSVYQLK